jgi:hypothetical protein
MITAAAGCVLAASVTIPAISIRTREIPIGDLPDLPRRPDTRGRLITGLTPTTILRTLGTVGVFGSNAAARHRRPKILQANQRDHEAAQDMSCSGFDKFRQDAFYVIARCGSGVRVHRDEAG